MSTKTNQTLNVSREAIASYAQALKMITADAESRVNSLQASFKYFLDPENLGGTDAEEFREMVTTTQQALNVLVKRYETISLACDKTLSVMQVSFNRVKSIDESLEDLKKSVAEFKAVAK